MKHILKDKRKQLAWLFLKRRIQLMPMCVREHNRDMVGQLIANIITICKLANLIFTGNFKEPNEIEYRAVRNSHRRLKQNTN